MDVCSVHIWNFYNYTREPAEPLSFPILRKRHSHFSNGGARHLLNKIHYYDTHAEIDK